MPLRIATYNINWGNVGLPAVVEAIRESDADVVCLQETNAESARFIRQTLSRTYPVIRFYGSVQKYRAAGFGLLSRIPLLSETFLEADGGLFGSCLLELDHMGGAVQVVNVHLQPVIFDRQRGENGLLAVKDALLDAEAVHKKEIEHILPHLETDRPSIIVGDFNSLSSFQSPTILRERGYVDSFASVTANADTHPTWHWPTKLGNVSLRIDYIFHSPHWQTAESRVVATEGSDHYLVVSTLETSDNRERAEPLSP